MKQGKANASTVTNTLEVIPDAPAPEPFVVGAGEPETLVLLNGSVVDAPPSVPERKEKILLRHYILRNKKKSHYVIHVCRKN